MNKEHGTHIILDIYNVDMKCFDHVDPNTFVSNLVGKHGLRSLGSLCHIFDENANSFISCVSLVESHMSINTWPELNYISADIFVCNYSCDNSSKTKAVRDDLINFLDNPKLDIKEQILIR